MKFYSELTREIYDTADQCAEAEAKLRKEEEERKNGEKVARAELDKRFAEFNFENDKVKKAQEGLEAATKNMHDAIATFQKKYGYIPDKYRSFQILGWLLR